MSNEILEILKPRLSIEYYEDYNCLTGGNFEYIPENIKGARIAHCFANVNCDGKYVMDAIEYNLYIGSEIDINTALMEPSRNEYQLDKLCELGKLGFKKAVFLETLDENNHIAIRPLGYEDMVCETREELIESINKIKSTFDSLKITVEETQKTR